MPEFDLPVMLTFHNHKDSSALVDALEQAREQVIWEQRAQEDGSVVVTILNIISFEEKAHFDEEER